MADPKYIELLGQGVDTWNAWREKNSGVLNVYLKGPDLKGADLEGAILAGTNFEKATLVDCRMYGVSAWDLNTKDTTQSDIIITPYGKDIIITVDNLEVAQFIYLIVNSEKVHHVVDSITSKIVLILGRFTPERKSILDAIREELRKHDYLPVAPLLRGGSGGEPAALDNLRKEHKSLLDTYLYSDSNQLLSSPGKKVIAPAEAKTKELNKSGIKNAS
ncbi:MAG: pentapeptide repeat-containing protein [Halobacteriota archaeon]|nr:pentapeptide repeat-containing protein [Halobacteriota archaeon]